jgi:hypothetical protein
VRDRREVDRISLTLKQPESMRTQAGERANLVRYLFGGFCPFDGHDPPPRSRR